jgi:hypothetical protein
MAQILTTVYLTLREIDFSVYLAVESANLADDRLC